MFGIVLVCYFGELCLVLGLSVCWLGDFCLALGLSVCWLGDFCWEIVVIWNKHK